MTINTLKQIHELMQQDLKHKEEQYEYDKECFDEFREKNGIGEWGINVTDDLKEGYEGWKRRVEESRHAAFLARVELGEFEQQDWK